ncbi:MULTISPECIES: MarR family winged helix-turn-helix transcriptional regulator [unclassified Frondihabitans]|uniref:MarR family winged helix-turn-helix transcriptional regulator n=1 Tax=unclassified Frondihabitans TaxID=2626248 RepID=UPI000F511B5A|nr:MULTISPECIES: MarR family transcriptional regulator [unclassified Frondihabitans]RPE78585.1 DNA-binding MarR family transcriptional regulator [Frondihabitans sp. PhB153]RPF08866.1 DNA-binding MarR family transcriptional regulator [Frondihabitans sp. PhB161]
MSSERSDEVDLLIDAWAGQLPETDFSPLDVMSRLRRVALNLNTVRAAAFKSAGLAIWEFDVLAALRRAGEPFELSPAQLVRITMVTSGTLTNRLDLLEERGLVERRKNPDDGRGVLVHMTDPGREMVDQAMLQLVAEEEVKLAPLTRQDRAQLIELLRRLGTDSNPADPA